MIATNYKLRPQEAEDVSKFGGEGLVAAFEKQLAEWFRVARPRDSDHISNLCNAVATLANITWIGIQRWLVPALRTWFNQANLLPVPLMCSICAYFWNGFELCQNLHHARDSFRHLHVGVNLRRQTVGVSRKLGGVLLLGDAVIGNPPGELGLIPESKLDDRTRLKTSLRKLLDYEFEILLLCDGKPVLGGGKRQLVAFLNALT